MSSAENYNPEAWITSSNKALKISIVDSNEAVQFHPAFTYPIYGDSEQIFGYKGLQLNLVFQASTMLPLIGMQYKGKLENQNEDKDPLVTLLEYFVDKNDVIINDENKWAEMCEIDLKEFSPFGKKCDEYNTNGKTFQIFKENLLSLRLQKFHKRIQIFVLLFIEAGSYIDTNDENWDYYMIFEKDSKKFIGFSTVYSYFKYPGSENFDQNEIHYKRKKISQFVILPPYQGMNHGEKLYNTMVDEWLSDDSVKEIVVEDPNESFDDLRDRNDLQRLLSLKNDTFFLKKILENGDFNEIPLNDEILLENQILYKMEKRQFQRCVEMCLIHYLQLMQFSPKDKRLLEKKIRLQIKKRIYIKNREGLEGLQSSDMRDKLQTAYQRLIEDYQRIMKNLTLSGKRGLSEDENDKQENPAKKQKQI